MEGAGEGLGRYTNLVQHWLDIKQMFMYKAANALHLRSSHFHFSCSFFIYIIIISKFLAIYKVDMIIIIFIKLSGSWAFQILELE